MSCHTPPPFWKFGWRINPPPPTHAPRQKGGGGAQYDWIMCGSYKLLDTWIVGPCMLLLSRTTTTLVPGIYALNDHHNGPSINNFRQVNRRIFSVKYLPLTYLAPSLPPSLVSKNRQYLQAGWNIPNKVKWQIAHPSSFGILRYFL